MEARIHLFINKFIIIFNVNYLLIRECADTLQLHSLILKLHSQNNIYDRYVSAIKCYWFTVSQVGCDVLVEEQWIRDGARFAEAVNIFGTNAERVGAAHL